MVDTKESKESNGNEFDTLLHVLSSLENYSSDNID